MKTTMWKAFAASLAMILLVLAPACRKKVQPPPKVVPSTAATTDTVPPVSTTVPQDVKVDTQPRDFVNDNRPTEEDLPLQDLERLNQVAQARGYIQDAFFDYDSPALTADAQSALTASATWLRSHPDLKLLIEGHCDERGTEQYNLALGDRRANTVREFLAAQGIDAGRMRTVSYGEERPFDDGHDEAAWAKNRRAHLVLVR